MDRWLRKQVMTLNRSDFKDFFVIGVSLFCRPASYLWTQTPLGDRPVEQRPTSAFETQVPLQSLFSETHCSFFFWLHHVLVAPQLSSPTRDWTLVSCIGVAKSRTRLSDWTELNWPCTGWWICNPWTPRGGPRCPSVAVFLRRFHCAWLLTVPVT